MDQTRGLELAASFAVAVVSIDTAADTGNSDDSVLGMSEAAVQEMVRAVLPLRTVANEAEKMLPLACSSIQRPETRETLDCLCCGYDTAVVGTVIVVAAVMQAQQDLAAAHSDVLAVELTSLEQETSDRVGIHGASVEQVIDAAPTHVEVVVEEDRLFEHHG
jgi:hypothetical protein